MNTNRIDWAGEVAGALSAMKDETQKAYTYLKQEAPEVGAEYVRWQMISAGSGFTFFLLCAAAMAYLSRRLIKAKCDISGLCILTLPITVFFLLMAFTSAKSFTKCIVAPRIVLIEGIKEIVK